MTKRWSSGREHLPIFHEDRPILESLFIVLMINVLAVIIGLMFLVPLLLFMI